MRCRPLPTPIASQAPGRSLTAARSRTVDILFGAIPAVRGLMLTPGLDPRVTQSPLEVLNLVWHPNLAGLTNLNTWQAAAGQIFFTLSLGMRDSNV